MDFNIWFWVWVSLAVILSIAEIFTAGFFLLPFGAGAAVAAAIEYFFPGTIGWQWFAFLAVSSVLLVLLRRIANSLTHEPPMRVAGDRLLGKCGVVSVAIADGQSRGRVRVDREDWQADAPGFEPLEAGVRVEVVAVEGTHLIVKPAPECGEE